MFQGDLEKLRDGVGSSFNTWLEFAGDESMEDIRKRAMFLHVSLPGQHPGAEDLPSDYVFPGMEVFWTLAILIYLQYAFRPLG